MNQIIFVTNVIRVFAGKHREEKKTGTSACFIVSERETGFEPATLSLGS